jgi:hypothetical protein
MGGTKDIWRKSNHNIGLNLKDTDKLNQLKEAQQSFNDQKLEFFTYSSGLKLGFEKIITGLADKIHHGHGPFIVKFRPIPDSNREDKLNRVYLNLDGEYFHIIKPIELRIRLNRKLSKGNVLFLGKIK